VLLEINAMRGASPSQAYVARPLPTRASSADGNYRKSVPVSIEKCRSMAIEFCRSTWVSDERLVRG
jgi:hypothetical protein